MALRKVGRTFSSESAARGREDALTEPERFRLAVAVAVAIGSLVLGLIGLLMDQSGGVVGIVGLVLIVFAVLGVGEALAIYRGYFTPDDRGTEANGQRRA